MTTDNLIEIKPTDKNFKQPGIYYIAVYPVLSIFEKIFGYEYKYTISYSTEDQFTYLLAAMPLDIS